MCNGGFSILKTIKRNQNNITSVFDGFLGFIGFGVIEEKIIITTDELKSNFVIRCARIFNEKCRRERKYFVLNNCRER